MTVSACAGQSCTQWRRAQCSPTRELLILVIHLFVTFAKILRPGGIRALAAESLLLKHQLLISNRSRLRVPNLCTLDRVGGEIVV
jgi:hypothetical protein